MAATLHCGPWMWLSLRYWLGLSDRHRALRAKAKSVSAEALLMSMRFSGSIKTIFWRAHQGVALVGMSAAASAADLALAQSLVLLLKRPIAKIVTKSR